jgi:DNA-binding transcriptional MerR regulator
MQIGAFSKATGISPDTIRFYVRKGLLNPEIGRKGGSNPYQIFTEEHVRTATMIRMGKSLGMTLKEFAAVQAIYLASGGTRESALQIMAEQLEKLETKAAELSALTTYLRAKMEWMKSGEKGPAPSLDRSAGPLTG